MVAKDFQGVGKLHQVRGVDLAMEVVKFMFSRPKIREKISRWNKPL